MVKNMNNILHIDCDAFYASCEELRNPKLKNKAIAVGGLSNKSVITTANYNARKYGIHSAMPVFIAKEKCPDLIIIPVDRKFYIDKSREVFSIVKAYAKIFEQVSIDEAYIQIDNVDKVEIFAKNLQEEILKKTGIGISIGISYNKFLAKISSDWNKPHGIKTISKEDIPDILLDLKISKVHGIGKKGVDKLENIGIYKISDLLKLEKDFLIDLFGKNGSYIYNVIRGIDNRQVSPRSLRKSIARETTFNKNTKDKNKLYNYLLKLSQYLEKDLEIKNLQAKTVNIKVKYDNFQNHTKSLTLQEPIYKKDEIYKISKDLLDSIYDDKYIRLIGISLSKLSSKGLNQLSFI